MARVANTLCHNQDHFAWPGEAPRSFGFHYQLARIGARKKFCKIGPKGLAGRLVNQRMLA
jgi:hypothetical protein